jgi:hypothetical protein
MLLEKRFRMLLTVSAFLLTAISVSQAQYSGGSGTADDPYQIATPTDLITLGETPGDYDKHFILTADIDLDPNLPGGKVFDRAVIAAGAWVSGGTGFTGTLFTGDFDGNGHTILNLTIDIRTGNSWPFGQTGNTGLFGQTGDGATISNLCMEAVDIIGFRFVGGLVGFNHGSITGSYSTGSIDAMSWYAGGLVGFNHGSESSITSSYSTCTIKGGQYVGGLVGENSGNITECRSTGTIDGEENIGGLVGFIEKGSVTASYSSATVTGDTNIGGLVGENWGGSVTMSYSTGSVVGIEDIGGLVGSNRSDVTSSFCTGAASATNTVGGLVGRNSGSVLNTYSIGTVFGDSGVGGLVGRNHRGSGRGSRSGTINMSYSTARVSGSEFAGGLVGFNGNGSVSSSFWNTETSNQPTSDGGIGLTTSGMQTSTTFLEAGWDFVGETENGPNDVWKIVEGQMYPLLFWQKYGGGTGEPNDPYLIYTAEHLNALGAEPNDYDKHFKLMADIDLSGYVYDQAVIAPDVNDLEEGFQGSHFVGVLDGTGHIISGLKIDGDSFLGLFGSTLMGAEISNLGLESVDVHGFSDYIGALVGKNGGAIIASWVNVSSCFSSGRVRGHKSVGGLVGYNGSRIVTSYSTCAVEGYWQVGGLVGCNAWGMLSGVGAAANPRGTIIMSYSRGSVAGDVAVGSLVGYGTFSSVSGFWDMNTAGQTESHYGIGLTTAEMQTAATFLEAGWDFIGETANGTDDIWWIDEGQDYPRLWWELDPEN